MWSVLFALQLFTFWQGNEVLPISVIIDNVKQQSPAWKKGVRAGDTLLSINSHAIDDFLDYQFYLSEPKLRLTLQNTEGLFRIFTVHKPQYEDIGIVFQDFFMDTQKRCKNNCIFCFIDQLPKGMRETLYFKDDDARLSFLYGNYITLTNLTDRDVERIIEMHISPVNISVHTTDPDLRVQMMHNKHAGEALSKLHRLAEAGVTINTQLVLCPGVNDGTALERTLADLACLYPSVQMVAAVPLGVTKYRENLAQLEQYTPQTAAKTLDIIESFAQTFYEEKGVHFAWAADEFYLKADRLLPDATYYEDFAQLENGVGMCSLLHREFLETVAELDVGTTKRSVTLATGTAAAPLLTRMTEALCQKNPNLIVQVIPITNQFFGETITVAGLIVGQDLINQLQNKVLGDELLIPRSMLRSEGDLFLDDVSLQDVEKALQVKVTPVRDDGRLLVECILGDSACSGRK